MTQPVAGYCDFCATMYPVADTVDNTDALDQCKLIPISRLTDRKTAALVMFTEPTLFVCLKCCPSVLIWGQSIYKRCNSCEFFYLTATNNLVYGHYLHDKECKKMLKTILPPEARHIIRRKIKR